MFSEKIHRSIYIFSLCLLSASIPVSVFMMSVSQFILVINYLIEGNFKEKFRLLKQNKLAIIISFIFVIHIVWMLIIYPQDYKYALNDLRIKLPILILPLVIGSCQKLSNKELNQILFSILVVFTFSSFIIIFRFIFKDFLNITDYRQYSPYISHIRYSLIGVFCSFISLYFFKNNVYKLKFVWLILCLYVIFLILLIKAYTGIVVLFFVWFFYVIMYEHNKIIRIILIGLSLLLLLFVSLRFIEIVNEFKKGYSLQLPDKTFYSDKGNPYYFIKENYDVENGNRVWYWLCESELKEEWNKRSNYKYDSIGKNGYLIKCTILRYLTSKGLKKDAKGCSSLTDEEVKAIENGISNVRYLKNDFLTNMIYNIVWQFYHFKTMNYSEGMSIVQRYLYLKTALYIIRNNFWCGVGTGNVQKVFNKSYVETNSNLPEEYRLRAHNQYLTFFISFGVLGFLLVWFIYFYVFLKNFNYKKGFLFIIFFVITLLSFLNEDTLETQAGVTFVIFFYVVFSIGLSPELTIKSDKNYIIENETP